VKLTLDRHGMFGWINELVPAGVGVGHEMSKFHRTLTSINRYA
jgi:hypothetical protein